jgi:hypothetical protein
MRKLIYTFKTNKNIPQLSEFCAENKIEFIVLEKPNQGLQEIKQLLEDNMETFQIIGMAEVKRGSSRAEKYAYNIFHQHKIAQELPERINLETNSFKLKSQAQMGTTFCNWSIFKLYMLCGNKHQYSFLHIKKSENNLLNIKSWLS